MREDERTKVRQTYRENFVHREMPKEYASLVRCCYLADGIESKPISTLEKQEALIRPASLIKGQ